MPIAFLCTVEGPSSALFEPGPVFVCAEAEQSRWQDTATLERGSRALPV